METEIACCGLICNTCPVHLAGLEQDPAKHLQLQQYVVNQLMGIYNIKLNPQDIDGCNGCNADEAHISFICRNCRIRECAKERHLSSCAFCSEYTCSTLKDLFALDPEAQVRLDVIRQDSGNRFA